MACYIVTRGLRGAAAFYSFQETGNRSSGTYEQTVPGFDGGRKQSSQVAVLLGNSLQCQTNRPGYRDTGAFRTGGALTVRAGVLIPLFRGRQASTVSFDSI